VFPCTATPDSEEFLVSRRYGLKTAAAVAVAAAAAMAKATGLAQSAGAAPGHPARAGGPAGAPVAGAARPAGAGRQLLLITGDRVPVNPADGLTGPGVIGPTGRTARAGPLMELSLGGHRYDIPGVALPYLGHGLAPGLFEPSLLLAHERDGRLPVRVSYTGRVPALPGVTLTRSGGGTALGYLTETSARAFGAALERLYRADHARASYGADGMFGGGTTIALAGTPPARPTAHPDYPMRTLKIKATNLLGKPDTGDLVYVFNVDSTDRVDQDQTFQASFYHGEAGYSVPVGHYMALGVFGLDVAHIVVLPQFTVTTAPDTTVTMHETAASSPVTTVTPRPAVVLGQAVMLLRTGTSGGPIGVAWVSSGGGGLYFSPTHTKPAIGTLRLDVSTQLESPPGRAAPYEYTLSYTDPPGIIPEQRYVAHAKDLATIHERFDQPVKSSGLFWFSGAFPLRRLDGIVSWYLPLAVPGGLTEYVGGTGTARVAWWGTYSPYVPVSGGGVSGGGAGGVPPALTESARLLRPGEHLTDVWSAYPLHPAANVLFTSEQTRQGAAQPSAVRAGNTLRLEVDPFDDSTPGHLIGLLQQTSTSAITGSYQIDQNGTKVAGGNAVTQVGPNSEFYTQARLSSRPSTIRFSLDLARTDRYFPLSTATSTVWTWHSAPVTGATLPPGWSCVPHTTGRDCAIEPMMTLGYAVAHLGRRGAAPAGPQRVRLTVGHLQAATATAITKASVSVSFDGGTTWHPAALTGTGGSYTASFTAPAGAKVSLRTSAGDAAGGTVAETITDAYQIAS
jgi:hypothetical protein